MKALTLLFFCAVLSLNPWESNAGGKQGKLPIQSSKNPHDMKKRMLENGLNLRTQGDVPVQHGKQNYILPKGTPVNVGFDHKGEVNSIKPANKQVIKVMEHGD